MSLPNENPHMQSVNQEAEKERLKQEIAQLIANTVSPQRRRLLELSARILDTDAPLLTIDEINARLGREYRYE